MKVIQFIRPLFLVALGLHASILFLPIGDDSDSALIEEDVPLATLTDSPQAAALGELPVPDPNVGALNPAAAAPKAAAKATVATKAPPTAVAVRPAPVPAAAVRSAGSGSGSGSGSGGGSAIAPAPVTPINSSNSSATVTPTVTPTVNAPPAVPDAPVAAAAQQSSFLPDLTADSSEDAESSVAANSDSAQPVAANSASDNASDNADVATDSPKLSQLIASAQTEVPVSLAASLEDLAEALIYDPEGTGDAIAQQKRQVWQVETGAQATAGRIENAEPILVSDVVLAYPVESAEVLKGRSLTTCLDEEPHSAEIGLVFDKQGELVGEPELIRSTGYKILNEEAIALATLPENLPENPAAKAYLYDITVDYDNERCVSLKDLQN